MRVLIVRASSLGDIIHTLPALTDAKKNLPDIEFDWVVEEAFQKIPSWHPTVSRVIPVALRRWRKPAELFKAIFKGEIFNSIKSVRQEHYDLILDAQGLLKTTLITAFSRGKVAGYSFTSAREKIASVFYRYRIEVPWDQHAITRTRMLFAKALGYSLPNDSPDHGISPPEKFPFPLEGPYVVLLHGTAWDSKHWPEAYWIALSKLIAKAGYKIQLLWGDKKEQERALRIAKAVEAVHVLPTKLGLNEVAALLNAASGTVTLDTGLGHLSDALGVPSVGLFGPTAASYVGLLRKGQINLQANFPCSPCFERTCQFATPKAPDASCFFKITPEMVWEKLASIIRKPVLSENTQLNI